MFFVTYHVEQLAYQVGRRAFLKSNMSMESRWKQNMYHLLVKLPDTSDCFNKRNYFLLDGRLDVGSLVIMYPFYEFQLRDFEFLCSGCKFG